MKIAWATDIHLNFVAESQFEALCERIAASGAERLLVGGDIAEASSLVGWLTFLADHLDVDVCFVLGNHDYVSDESPGLQRHVVPELVPSFRVPPYWTDEIRFDAGVSLILIDSHKIYHRPEERAHFLTDVYAGMLVGLACAAFVSSRARASRRASP